MELKGERTIPASRESTWAALNDPETLKACIAGCESLEKTGDDAYTAVVAMRVGPVSARFRGNLTMTNVDPPRAYTILFDGQGGVAGFGKGSADVSLAPAGDHETVLAYVAKANVGGKLAQIGSRLVDAAAGKVANDFFAAFEKLLRERNPAPVPVAAPLPLPLAGDGRGEGAAPPRAATPIVAPVLATPGDPMLAALARRAARARAPRPIDGLDWILVALVVALTLLIALAF